MKKVVLFKAPSDDYREAFTAHNYQVVFVEPLQFDFINLEELGTKLLQTDYDGLILTSPRAIEAAANNWNPTKFVIWHSRRVYTLGDASAHKIKLLLGLDAVGTNAGNAENLAKIIVDENRNSSRYLFPCGNLSSEMLPKILSDKGIIVDSLTVYETKENDNLGRDLLAINNSDVQPCGLVFFSPSGCEYVHRQLQMFNNRLYHLPHFAIGNSTAHRIENLGLEIAGVAERPKPECVIESIEKFFKSQSSS